MTTLSNEFEIGNPMTIEEESIDSSQLSVLHSAQLTDAEIESAELTQNYSELVQVGDFTGGIKIRKPDKLEFIRVHAEWPPYRVAIIKEKLSDFYVTGSTNVP